MITTNTGAKKIEGTDNWREIFDAHNDSVNAHDKVSEGMTYVVNGNKSIENAAIPVGSLVRLANSTIVGRSDGIYTVKTAIPVDTVIDSSYFNESAPIAGGIANALNDKITTITGTLPASGQYDTVSFPNGFNVNNTVILNGQFKISSEVVWRPFVGGWPLASSHDYEVSAVVSSEGIRITTRGEAVGGASYKIALLKQ